MKRLPLLFILILTSCGGKVVENENQYDCIMVNGSSHIVTVELEDYHNDFPTKLELTPNEEYQWIRYAVSSLTPFNFREGWAIKVTFDDSRQIIYTIDVFQRNPYWENNYVITKIRNNEYRAVYTFADEDFENAEEI